MNQPLVSVAMAVCNAERFLAEAIESILGQTFTDFEFIIFDYGSTDNSKSIISSYAARDSRIKFREVPPCVLPVARNASCSLAQGRYIAIMDADDVSLPNRLSREVDYMESHPRVALLGGAVEWMDSSGRPFIVARHPTESGELKSEMATHCTFWHPTVIMRREAYGAVGGYRPAFVCAHDYDLELRIAEKFDCANLSEVVLKYRIHPGQLSMQRWNQQAWGILATQASASTRKNGDPDPLDSAKEITPAILAQLGVTDASVQSMLVAVRRQWIRHMCWAGEFSVALHAAIELSHNDWRLVERRQIADLYLTMAWLYWRQKNFLRCLIAAGRAVVTRPIVAGRPLKPLLHRLGLAR
jgi:hypothetical protein